MGRFSKYTSSEFNPLIKLEPGEEFVRRVVGAHEYTSKSADDDGKPKVVVVLDFEKDSCARAHGTPRRS
jgi:hypothetical protein